MLFNFFSKLILIITRSLSLHKPIMDYASTQPSV